MRLETLRVAGFRGFGGAYEFDLSADVLLIHGPNGAGKTSLFDAVLWAVTGVVDRLGPDSDLVSRYSEFGEARVELTLRDAGGKPLRITRRHEQQTTLTVEVDDTRLAGAAAEARLFELLWPDAATAANPRQSLARSVTRAVYLQQDQVRSFIEAEDEQGRFEIVGEIVGAGRVGELVRQLEGSRKAWTTASNRQRDDIEPLLRRRAAIYAEADSLRVIAEDSETFDSDWRAWVAEAVAATSGEPFLAEESGSRARLADRLLNELRVAQRSAEQRLARHQELVRLVTDPPRPAEGLPEAREAHSRAVQQAAALRAQLAGAEAAAAELRRRQVAAVEESSSLAAMAELALRHLSDSCPVCQQAYDRGSTEAHLRSLRDAPTSRGDDLPMDVPQIAAEVSEAEQAEVQARAEVRRLDALQQQRIEWADQVSRLAAELALRTGPEEASAAAKEAVAVLTTRVDRLAGARRTGEMLSVALARRDQSSRLSELLALLPALDEQIERQSRDLAMRDAAGSDAKALHEALRALSESLVATELERIEPLVQRIYASVDPHPSFRAVRFLTQTRRGRGHLWASVEDAVMGLSESQPSVVLSSSQLNVLAVVSFLALNLAVRTLPLQLAALDDPLQSLDNVNLLGLADLLRRVRGSRQVMLSTHDERLVGLLERKLRPVESTQRTSVIHMDGWARGGPQVLQRDVPLDTSGLRLVRPA
jgi:DNA repair exonuclease SbcCD ATPase subunit